MKAGRGGGWQIVLADLALILFVAMAVRGDPAVTRDPLDTATAPDAALALWRGDGSGELQDWLAMQAGDPRATLELHLACPPPLQTCLAQGLPPDIDRMARRFGGMRLTIVSREARTAEARLVYR